ncbi:MAG: DMT family transporter [Pseudomonadota bacterium]
MVGSMAAFAVGDALIKQATTGLSAAQVVLIMACVGSLFFIGLLLRAGDRLLSPDLLNPVIVSRNVIEGLTACAIITALSLAPMSLVISITQIVPLVVTAGAALILRELVGPRRWIAVCIGFVGVLVMLRPDSSTGVLGPLLALAGSIGLGTRDLASRMAPASVTTVQMSTWGMMSLLPAGIVLLLTTGPHPPLVQPALWAAIAASLATAMGYFAVTSAMRLGSVATVAPFRYTRLVFALIIAILVLGERPDLLTLIGAGVVVSSGLFVLFRERRLSRTAR